MSADESVWLIKSSGLILGPYTKDQVMESLRSREFGILDEASLPGQRWRSIREQPEFFDVLDEIRHAILKDAGSDFTDSFTGSTTAINPAFDSQTPTADIPIMRRELSRAEVVVDRVTETPTPRTQQQPNVNSYGLASDARIQEQVNRKVRFYWLLSTLIVVAAFAYVWDQQRKQVVQGKTVVRDDFADAMAAMEVGDMNIALEKFKNVYARDPNNRNLDVYLGALLIQLEGQTVLGRRLLTRSLESQGQFKKQAWTGIGLANMNDGEWASAEEAFQQALKEDAFFFPALINLGVLATQKRNWIQAKNFIQSAIDKGAEEGAAYLMLAEVYISIWRSSKNNSDLLEAQRVLQDYARNGFDYLQEAQLMLAYIEFLQGAKSKSENRIDQMLDLDPEQTNSHRHNLFINTSQVAWPKLLKYCEQMRDDMGKSARAAAFISYCQFKAGQKGSAKNSIEGAVAQAPRDGLVQSLYGYMLRAGGLEEQASVAIGKALEIDSKNAWMLPLTLQGRFCEKRKDWDCAKDSWTKVLARQNNQLASIAGLGQVYFNQKKWAEAKEQLTKGLSLSADYIPLRRLAKQMESEGLR